MDETTICECGADSNFSHRYILTNFWYVICGLSYLLKKHKPINIFLPRNSPPSVGYLY